MNDSDTCEHGLSASLCAGPGHYPSDDQFLDLDNSVQERYAGEYLGNDGDDPSDDELLFLTYGLTIFSPDYCQSPGGWHTPQCPNQPACPF